MDLRKIQRLNEEMRTLLEDRGFIQGIKDDVNYFFNKNKMSGDNKLTYFYDKYVPSEGPAKTVGGEIVRAVNRIGYRWNNDGDYFYKGYGLETAAGSALYLLEKIPELRSLLSEMTNMWKEHYSKSLNTLYDKVAQYLEKNPKLFKEPNTEDSREYSPSDSDIQEYYGYVWGRSDEHLRLKDATSDYESFEEAIRAAKNEIESQYEVIDFDYDEQGTTWEGEEAGWFNAIVKEVSYNNYGEEDEEDDREEIELAGSVVLTERILVI